MKLKQLEELIIRYIGQNTTKGESSDVHFDELESMMGVSWYNMKAVIDYIRDELKLITGRHTKGSFLKLTTKGWEVYGEVSKIEFVGVAKQLSPTVKVAPKKRQPRNTNKVVIMVTFNGQTMELKNSLSTKVFAGVDEVIVDKELPDTIYFNNAWFKKKGILVEVKT